MNAQPSTTSTRVSNAQLSEQLTQLIGAVTGLANVVGSLVQAGQYNTPAAVVTELSEARAAKAAPRKAAAKKAPAKTAAQKATGKAATKAVDPAAAAKRAAEAEAWRAHKEIRSIVNRAFAAAGVKFTAGTLDRFTDADAVKAMLTKVEPSRKADAKAFVAKMAAKAAEQGSESRR